MIFRLISSRILKHIFCDTPDITHPWINAKAILHAYSPISCIRIEPIFPKLICPVPEILAISPLNNSVVAFPRIFGPMTLKMVEPTAKIMTMITAILYLPM